MLDGVEARYAWPHSADTFVPAVLRGEVYVIIFVNINWTKLDE